MRLDLGLIAQNLPDVLQAAGVTALVWSASAVGGLALGFPGGRSGVATDRDGSGSRFLRSSRWCAARLS